MRSGGEADKLGNHYEGAWIVAQLLEVLAGRAKALTVEELGEIGKGVEFTLRRASVTEVHQVKRQRGSANYWRLGDLRSEGVLGAAHQHVAAGREFHFVSTIPAQALHELAELARRSPEPKTFVNTLAGKSSQEGFGYLVSKVYSSEQEAWETLRGTWAHWSGEREIRNRNAAIAGLLIGGAPAPVVAIALADLAVENLSTPLDKRKISENLERYELALISTGDMRSSEDAIRDLNLSWKASIERELLSPPIRRPEVDQIAEALLGDDRCLFAIGSGGVGKSAVLHGAVTQMESAGSIVLTLRLDRQEPFSSTHELGQRFGFATSPVSMLARVSAEQPCLLVIDQLDAVSKASGRMPQSFDAVADLVREAAAFPYMRVLLACRKFDLDNDDSIRSLVQDRQAKQCEIVGLSLEQVAAAIESMGIAPYQLTHQQKDLLRLPLHLKLLATLADQADAISFTSTRSLFDAYWDRKRRDCRTRRGGVVRFAEVVATLADDMSGSRRLWSPVSVLDDADLLDDAELLASEHVLVRIGQKLSFFHETFFDYAFARRWSRRGQTLVQFLLGGEQELFRRAQVRQILTYIREEDQGRFISETEELLVNVQVRFHVKHVVLGLLRALPTPTTDERLMVERLLALDIPFANEIWLALRALPWFDRLDADGLFGKWLSNGDPKLQSRAMEVILGGVKERPDRIAELLAPHAGKAEQYSSWLRWVTRFADVYKSWALFELVETGVARGDYDGHEGELFISVHGLGQQRPEWAIELLVAYIVERPGAMNLDSSGNVVALQLTDYSAIGLIGEAASGAPAAFAQAFIPYMQRVMAITAFGQDSGLIHSRHFMLRNCEPPYHKLEDALAAASVSALRSFVKEEPDKARPLVDQLVADPHEAGQWLAYEALAAAGPAYADTATAMLLDRENGLQAVNSWTIRQLVQAVSTYLADEAFVRLERAILEFRPSWDSRPSGQASFVLLSAMDEGRLSETGRRRLRELRRLLNTSQPAPPQKVTAGIMGSPIPQGAAHHMSDSQWLRAMEKHNTEREDWVKFRGGARELSHVLQEEVKNYPARFALLSLRLGADTHPSYPEAILLGLGGTDVPVDSELVFDAVQHLATLSDAARDRWLGWALQKHLKAQVPDEIIETLIDRALRAPNPMDDNEVLDSTTAESPYRDELLERGINTSRGHCAESLGNILVYDADGCRTALVMPVLNQLASDPSLAVRACVAHVISACFRHAQAQAIAAFHILVDTHDILFTTRYVEQLICQVGRYDIDVIASVIERMLASTTARVRRVGGRLAAYVSLELGMDLLRIVSQSADSYTRRGAAEVCAGRLPHAANAVAAADAICQFVQDEDREVQEAASNVVVALRDRALQPFEQELVALIESPSFSAAIPQLLITLDRAPDRIDNLILNCVRRFLDLHSSAARDISTRAAADAREVGELLMKAYAQASHVSGRSDVLDLIDSLLMSGAYGVDELVDAVNRW